MAAIASLAFGIAGGLIGGPIGYLAGSLLGSLLFPQTIQGPRLTDLKLQTSSYGGVLPIVYGMMPVAPNISWQTDLHEHEQDSGGKGGPEVQNFTYSASFRLSLCEGPIAGVGKIWANGRLLYDALNTLANQDPLPMTVYLGTEDQMPDPTMESFLGAWNVPAYRGEAGIVFNELDLSQFGNVMPNWKIEVFTTLEGTIPQQVSTVSGGLITQGATYDPNTGLVTQGLYDNNSPANYIETTYDLLTGTVAAGPTTTPCDAIDDPDVGEVFPVGFNPNDGVQSACLQHLGSGTQMGWYHKAAVGALPEPRVDPPFALHYNFRGIFQKGAIYSIDKTTASVLSLQKWNTDDTGMVIGTTADASTSSIFQTSSSNYCFGSSDTGDVYLFYKGNIGADPLIQQFDGDTLELKKTYTTADLPGWTGVGGSFVVYRGMIAITTTAGFGSQTVVLYDLASLGPSSMPIGTLTIGGTASEGISRLSGGYCIVSNGFVSLDRQPGTVKLSDIVADLSRRAALDDSQFDTSGLPDLVRGYMITQQQTVRDDINPLRQAYFFDGSEVDGKIVFVKRGGASAVTIPDDDLAAFGDGDSPPPLLSTDRAPETNLPAQITVNFVNKETDYETGSQQAQRQATQSQDKVTIDLPISLSNDEAKAIAQKQLATAWLERDTHSILLPRKYSKYVPTDVVTAHGVAIHVRNKTETAAGVIRLDGVPSLATIFIQAPKSAGGSGFTSSPPTPTSRPSTNLALLDLPLVTDVDAPDGYYVGMDGAAAGWPGAALFESVDGSSYSSVFSETKAQALGTTSDVLPVFLGGNTFDEGSTVTVVTDGGALPSATADAVLNGANVAAIGAELVQFKNATLTAPNTYVLSGLLRGRRGTEWAMAHRVGERFVLLPAARVAQPRGELNLTRSFKAVTSGATVASATAQTFVNTGAALKPYAPVLLGGGTDASGDVALRGTLRTRTGGAWQPFVDVTQADSTDCVFQIWNADFSQVARIIETTGPTTTYTSAQQVADFGAQQRNIYFTLAQKGSIGIGYQARGTAVGAGSSNNDPLSPVSPYQSITSGSPAPAPSSVPQLTLSMGWANVRKLSSSVGTFNCSNILVCSFTTPAATANGVIGWISAVEWIDPDTFRTACLSTVAGDFSGTVLGTNSRVVSKDPTCFFSVGTNADRYPQLSPSTTYYFNVANDDGAGACTCLGGSCGVAVELTKPSGL